MLVARTGLLASGSDCGSKAKGESGPTFIYHTLKHAIGMSFYIPRHQKYSPQVFLLLLLEEDFLRSVKTKLLSFYVQPEAASPLTPWTPGLAFPGQQQQDGPPAFVLLKKIRKTRIYSKQHFISDFHRYLLAIQHCHFNTNLKAGRQLDRPTFSENKLIMAFWGRYTLFSKAARLKGFHDGRSWDGHWKSQNALMHGAQHTPSRQGRMPCGKCLSAEGMTSC